jgi:hypothetical protein
MYRRECKAHGGDALKVFNKMIKSGEPAGFAAACALQQAPMSKNTDRTFCDGHRRKMNTMDDYNRKKILEAAKKAGINTHGKFFNGIGRYSDPASWSSNQQDVIDAAKRKNLKLEGPVNCNYMREDLPPPKKKPLAEDIVKNEALKLMTADPALAAKVRKSPKAKEDLRRQIQATHSRG